MKAFFRNIADRGAGFDRSGLPAWAQRWLEDPYHFHINRRSVANATAIGLALAWLPLPFQSILAVLAALQLRANVPISAALVWVTNPITIPPAIYAAYRLGLELLGRPAPEHTPGWLWHAQPGELLFEVAKPLLLGCGVLAVLSGGLGYLAVNALWRASVLRRRREGPQRRVLRAP